MALVDGKNLCKRGRGKRAVRCPLFDQCGVQRQQQIKANIWFAAHECMVHELPRTFGEVGLVMIDEFADRRPHVRHRRQRSGHARARRAAHPAGVEIAAGQHQADARTQAAL